MERIRTLFLLLFKFDLAVSLEYDNGTDVSGDGTFDGCGDCLGWIKITVIVGIVVGILILIAIVAAICFGVFAMLGYSCGCLKATEAPRRVRSPNADGIAVAGSSDGTRFNYPPPQYEHALYGESYLPNLQNKSSTPPPSHSSLDHRDPPPPTYSSLHVPATSGTNIIVQSNVNCISENRQTESDNTTHVTSNYTPPIAL